MNHAGSREAGAVPRGAALRTDRRALLTLPRTMAAVKRGFGDTLAAAPESQASSPAGPNETLRSSAADGLPRLSDRILA